MLKAVEYQYNPRLSGVFVRERSRQILEASPELFRDSGKKALFFGQSDVEGFFDPHALEQRLKAENIDLRVYNLGLRSMSADFALDFFTAIKNAQPRADAKFKWIFFNFHPSRLTKAAATSQWQRDNNTLRAQLFTAPELLKLLPINPQRAFALFIEKYFWFGSSPSSLSAALTFKQSSGDWLPALDVSSDPFGQIFTRGKYLETPEFRLGQGGMYRFNFVNYPAELSSALAPESLTSGRAERLKFEIECCDMLNLELDEKSVADLLNAIRILKPMTEHLVFLLSPSSPEVEAQRPAAARAAVQALIERIKILDDVQILSSFDKPLVEDDFYDSVHMKPSGWNKMFNGILTKIKEKIK
ncbi:MAG: hypothetical protein ACXVA9_02810 [Bdellovibrionales bacterium]